MNAEAAGSTQEIDPCDQLADVVAKATVALGRAGKPTEASRLAAAGYAAIWRTHSDSANRLNAVMHGLAKMPGAERVPIPDEKEESPMASTTIDVRPEPPIRRHALIFETFDGLPKGDDFELINDHDPKPLYYQLEAEQTGLFTWDYLEEGPEVWRVRIGRKA
jgi:uncharacterized protein (DUF2249 family)